MNGFQQWVCSPEFSKLAAQLSLGNEPDDFAEHFERLKAAVIEAEQRLRVETIEAFGGGFSRYTPAIVQFARATGAAAVYCFAVDGKLGTGGMPLVAGLPAAPEYRQRCEELIGLLRRSAELLEQDLARQVPLGPEGGAGSVG